jgi:hypothetical protein
MYYTYGHYTKDTQSLFYIGKGKGKRCFSLVGRNNWWKRKVDKHGGFTVEILVKWDKEEDAFQHEKFLVSCLKDSLVNLTEGGEGVSGYKHTAEALQKISAINKGKTFSIEHKKKISESILGKKKTKEHLTNMGIAHKKPVLCLSTGISYSSALEAEQLTGCNAGNIAKCCKGKIKHVKKMQWAYA